MDASLLQRIDFERIANNLGNDRIVIRDMLELFIRTTEDALRKLEKAEKEANSETWLQTLHYMKGGAHNATAKRLVTLCLEAEAIEKLPHENAASLIYHINKELALLKEAIAKHLSGGRDLLL